MPEGRSVFDLTFFVLLAALAALGAIAFARGGGELVAAGLGDGARLLLRYAPMLVLSFLAAGFADKLVPHELVRAHLGERAGGSGILLGALAGILTPGGPFVSMPIAAVLIRAGAGAGTVVAFVSAWALLALHRFVAWEIPLLGWRIALLRYGVCVALPVAAGLLARLLAR
jgi:uncharacterized membrane protein YraQ (UPF0718 family)